MEDYTPALLVTRIKTLEAEIESLRFELEVLKRRASWTSVQEKLPGKGEYVLLITDRYWNTHDGVPDMHVAAVGYLDDYGTGNFWSVLGERGMEVNSFTHWMKIPDYPVEEV